MLSKMIIAAATLTALVAYPATSEAASACRSTWVKASAKVDTFFAPVAKLVCKQLNTDDAEAAQECIDNVEKYAEKAKEIHAEWNRGESSWTIGPRALPDNTTQTGAVSTERQFIGEPVITGSYELDLKRTDGKAKNDLIVKICFVDHNGNDIHYEQVRLNRDGRTEFKKTFTGVEGTVPLIHLNNEKWGTNAHQYTLRAETRGEPSALVNARKTLAATPKLGGKASKLPGR